MDMSPLDRHEKIVLQFSGGKDSIACLKLLAPYLHRITVLWMNTGEPLPEYAEQMARVRHICPHFIEVRHDIDADHAERGWPVDVLPLRNDKHVQYLSQQERMPLQSFMSCCMNNLMQPMHAATVATGATLIIRGQKKADGHRSPVTSGQVLGNVEFWFPVDEWSDDEVLAYVSDSGLLPQHFDQGNSSLDCWNCTAYLGEHQWKQPYLEKHHPQRAAEVKRRLILIRNEIMSDLRHMEAIDG